MRENTFQGRPINSNTVEKIDVCISILLGAVQTDLDLFLGTDKEAQQRFSALFPLKLKESKRLSQAAIDDIVHEWDGLFTPTVQRLQSRIRAKLATAGIDIDEIEGLNEVFRDVPNPFEGLETCYKQEKFYRETLGLVVRPLFSPGAHVLL